MQYLGIEYQVKNLPALDPAFIPFGVWASAYEAGADWLEQLKQYLAGNLAYIRQFLREKLPDIALIEPEGTYLVWLDLRKQRK